MDTSRKIIKVFIASPGDLTDERNVVREAVDEVNELFAKYQGYHVELMGWEDTVPGMGRPQALINQDLDKCDLFIGLMWKRWGTPPDNDGKYTSGFEEEFYRSHERYEENKKPEISLFFKDIDKSFLVDPGKDLQKVLYFRDEIAKSKLALYKNFSDDKKLAKLIRKCVSSYITKIKEEELLIAIDSNIESDQNISTTSTKQIKDVKDDSPLSNEGYMFLKDLLEKFEAIDAINLDEKLEPSDIARFRLLSNSVSLPGNDNRKLGVHDINLLYKNKDDIDFGERELKSLILLSVQYLEDQNTPLWYWYAKLNNYDEKELCYLTLTNESNAVKVGAIKMLTMLGSEMPHGLEREIFLNSWFKADSHTNIKNAALGYLSKNGLNEDIEIVRDEFEKNDYNTSRKALETTIELLSRHGSNAQASEFILQNQFDAIEDNLLDGIIDGFHYIDTSTLLVGLDHRNFRVKLMALDVLEERGELKEINLVKLFNDENAKVRYKVINLFDLLPENTESISAGSVLVKPKAAQGLSMLGASSSYDFEGNYYYDEYRKRKLFKLSEKELLDKVESSSVHDRFAYLVISEKYFNKYSDRLRKNIDDRFENNFNKKIDLLRGTISDESIKKTINLKDYICKELTRGSLNILCGKKQKKDLHRVRNALLGDFINLNEFDIGFFEKNGSWKDIELLTKKDVSYGLLLGRDGKKGNNKLAKLIYKLGRESISDLLSMEVSPLILINVISECSVSVVKDISSDVTFALLNHKDATVRKVFSKALIKSLNINQLKEILDDYVYRDEYRYYNVIHWLDLGVSMPRNIAKKVVAISL